MSKWVEKMVKNKKNLWKFVSDLVNMKKKIKKILWFIIKIHSNK